MIAKMVEADLERHDENSDLMRAFVTGADGFVGQWLLRRLLRDQRRSPA